MSEDLHRRGIGMTSQRTRERLIQRLYEEGLSNAHVLEVIRRTPRHLFVDEALSHRAYEDTALPIGHNQTISQPFMVARMTELLLAAGPLAEVALAARRCMRRTSDDLCRVGGDEFAAVLSAPSASAALAQAQRVLDAIRAIAPLDTPHGPRHVTATFGLAWIAPGVSLTWEQAYSDADRALYRAKQAGKNRLHLIASRTAGA